MCFSVDLSEESVLLAEGKIVTWEITKGADAQEASVEGL